MCGSLNFHADQGSKGPKSVQVYWKPTYLPIVIMIECILEMSESKKTTAKANEHKKYP